MTIDAGGNIPPVFGFAKQLLERNHNIYFLSEPCLEKAIKNLGAGFIPFDDYFTKSDRKDDILKDWNATLLNNPVFDNVIFGPSETLVKQTIKASQGHAIDAIVVDILLLPAIIAAEFLQIPKFLLFHMPEYMPGPNKPPGNLGLSPGQGLFYRIRDKILGKMMVIKFNDYKKQLNKLRLALNLPLLENTIDLVNNADLRIIQTLRSFDIPVEPAPSNVRYSGPVLDDPDWVQTEDWINPWAQDDQRPLVIISFSSTFQNQKKVIQNCLLALEEMEVRGLVTLGLAMENEYFDIPKNVIMMPSLRHSLVFPNADLVISHAGHGTIIRALSYGVPLICMPMGRDQYDNAIKVVRQNCGLKLSAQSNPAQIKNAINKILADSNYKIQANRLKNDILASQHIEEVVLELENIVSMNNNCPKK